MRLVINHEMLVDGPDFESCRDKVLHFFDNTILVKYDTIEVVGAESRSALEPEFWPRVEKGIAANREVVAGFFETLRKEGFTSFTDCLAMPQGFASKTLHTVVHLLDGFFGVDSILYNLVEDSLWLSERCRRRIGKNPEQFRLLKVKAGAGSKDPDRLAILRSGGGR